MITKGFGTNQKIITRGFGQRISTIIRREVIRLESFFTKTFSVMSQLWK